MVTILIQFILSAVIIVFAGFFLTKFADRISDLTGWGRVFVGSLLLAGATSLPELMVDLHAVKEGLPDLAVGDLLGSSLFNLLVLALLDFAYPSAFRRTAFSPVFLHHSLSAVLTIVLTSIVGLGIASRLESSIFGVSLFAWATLLVYLYGLRLIFIDGKKDDVVAKPNDLSGRSRWRLVSAFSGYILASVVILITAPYLVDAAEKVATQTGLGYTFVGTTLVALATSLPELISTLSAFRIGAPDLALGNIFGSNAFNMILFVPLDFLYAGPLFSVVKEIHAVSAFSVVTATAIAVMGQLYRKKERSSFTEPSSEIVVIVIFLCLMLLYTLKA
jgi:cation:H+ antiporter